MKPLPELTQRQKDRFWSRVDVRESTDCWPWAARKNDAGYGIIALLDADAFFAHRVAFALLKGLIHRTDLCCTNAGTSVVVIRRI